MREARWSLRWRLVIVAVVLALVAGALVFRQVKATEPWVAPASLKIDVCSLVDLDAIKSDSSSYRSDEDPVLTKHLLVSGRYIGDECQYKASYYGPIVLELSTDKVDSRDVLGRRRPLEGKQLSGIGDEAALANADDNKRLTIRSGEVQLTFRFWSSPTVKPPSAEIMTSIAKDVVDGLPESFRTPGLIAEGPCSAVPRSAIDQALHEPILFSRSLDSDDGRRTGCSFAAGNGLVATVEVDRRPPSGDVEEMEGGHQLSGPRDVELYAVPYQNPVVLASPAGGGALYRISVSESSDQEVRRADVVPLAEAVVRSVR